MGDKIHRILKLQKEGFSCSQILLQLGLEAQGLSNPGLIRAMTGLAGGLGCSGSICGALTGGACLLGLYAGKGEPGEEEHDRFFFMVNELVEWFAADIGQKCGGINCDDIIDCQLMHDTILPGCSHIISSTWNKVGEILKSSQISLANKGLV